MSKKKKKGDSMWSDAVNIIAVTVMSAAALAAGSLVASGLVSQIPTSIGNFLWLFLSIAVAIWVVKIMEHLDTPKGWLRAVRFGVGLLLGTMLVLWINGGWDATVNTPITSKLPSITMAVDVATLTATVVPIAIVAILLGLWGYRVQSKK